MEIEASTEGEVFRDALHGIGELLVGWLDELVYLTEMEDLVPEDAERVEVSERGVVATVRCHRGSPRHVIKAATYHRLAFERSGRGFRARVVLDV